MIQATELRQSLARNGYAVVPDFVSRETCKRLCDEAWRLVDAYDLEAEQGIFSTRDQGRTVDARFLASAEAVTCFLEEEAVDEKGVLGVPKTQAINKIGHALHDLNPVFRSFSRQPALASLVRGLGMEQPLLAQSMVIFKQPRIGGEVAWHQDSTFLYTEPSTVIGLWFALEDATLENGCLWAVPGGHRAGLKARFGRLPDGRVDYLERSGHDWPEDEALPLEVSAGSLVVLHGLLPHRSAPNRSGRSRLAYALHVLEGQADYPASNWLQRRHLPWRGF